jgi:hypothetical protein
MQNSMVDCGESIWIMFCADLYGRALVFVFRSCKPSDELKAVSSAALDLQLSFANKISLKEAL